MIQEQLSSRPIFKIFHQLSLSYNLHGLICKLPKSRLFNTTDLKPVVTWFIVENSRLVHIRGSLSRQVRGYSKPQKITNTHSLWGQSQEKRRRVKEEIRLLPPSLSSLASKLADGGCLQLISYQRSVTAASIAFRQQNVHPLHVLFTCFMLAWMLRSTSTRGAAQSQNFMPTTNMVIAEEIVIRKRQKRRQHCGRLKAVWINCNWRLQKVQKVAPFLKFQIGSNRDSHTAPTFCSGAALFGVCPWAFWECQHVMTWDLEQFGYRDHWGSVGIYSTSAINIHRGLVWVQGNRGRPSRETGPTV